MRFFGALVVAAISLSCVATAGPNRAPKVEPTAQAILAKHDQYGRFKSTRISKLGDLRAGSHVYSIYNLYHVNEFTGSGHGMQQVSIIKDGRTFVGSYLDVFMPMIEIKGRTVFQKRDSDMRPDSQRFSFTIGENGPPRKVLLGGNFIALEKSI
jgi:hypothetical protein